ncbi:MAG: Cytochrome c class [Fibrobacteria bacterium]|nr:Cytochrome c class [Fibrobacteria bacterium]
MHLTPNFAQAWYDRGQADYVPPVAINRYNQGSKTGWVGIAQPLWLTQGPYAGQILVGDINSHGLWRVALDTLIDTTGAQNMQGAVFYFNPGSTGNGTNGSILGTGNAGINRLTQGPDGTIYAGAGRGVGNWGSGSSSALMYVFKPKANSTQFEVMKIHSLKDGYELILNKKVDPKTVTNGSFSVKQRSWVRQAAYGMGFAPANSPTNTTGAPQFTNRTIDSIQVSTDSLRIRLKVSGIKRLNQDRRGDSVTHWHTVFFFGPKLLSKTGDSIYTNEADYAQNWIDTTTWNGGSIPRDTQVVVGLRQPSRLQNNVWFTQRPGFVNVNVDNMKPYLVVLRDLHGRVVDRKAGAAGVPLQIKAPGAAQSVYTLEVKSEGESYSRIFTF